MLKITQWPWTNVKVIMLYVAVQVLLFATIWWRFHGSTVISVQEMCKSLFFEIFKVSLWPWPWLKVIPKYMLWKALQQTAFCPSLVALVILVSEILSMFKFHDGRTVIRTDAGGSFYRLTSLHTWDKWMKTKINIQNRILISKNMGKGSFNKLKEPREVDVW